MADLSLAASSVCLHVWMSSCLLNGFACPCGGSRGPLRSEGLQPAPGIPGQFQSPLTALVKGELLYFQSELPFCLLQLFSDVADLNLPL